VENASRRTTDLELAREVLNSPDVSLRRASAKALEGRADLPENAVRVLGLALSDADRWVRESAARALGGQGPRAVSEVERLIAALKDDDPYVRWRVAEALGRVGPGAEAARAALSRHADDPDEVEVVRAASVKALERIGGAGAPK
jgi:HEAT repeat protein